ncbi:unnamed protein product [Onchocerca flexuosa]|uniref:Epoxide hydrolase n=1 Tax=Onchocerca flexuosa TaxID=387005 RepID=A0A183H076_9BILA|nr:unnamed protein product [Onchocerca flexuosa]
MKIADDGWFGSGKKGTDDERIIPFKVSVSDEAINDLKYRLRNARINYESLEECNDFSYGFNGKYLKHLANYWLNKYNWKYHEDIINSLPQFITEIEGLKIHFIHAKPREKYEVVVPLLIVHGWPGNVFEFHKIIPMLLDPVQQIGSDINVAFEVIAPSIPGFGWSGVPMKKGLSPKAAARIFNKLMVRLGFSRYLLQGGDFGSIIATNIAFYYPENIIGLHLNMVLIFNWKALLYRTVGTMVPKLVYSSKKFHQQDSTHAFFNEMLEETGYVHIQATKPDTVGAALTDSPVGLAAYILEKFSSWTNTTYRSLHDGGLTRKFTMDELLTIVSIYWFNGNIMNSLRFYKEHFKDPSRYHGFNLYINVPTGYASFPEDLIEQPEEIMRTMYNVTSYTEMKVGGHFAAFEEPKLLADDIIKFIKTIHLE